MSVILVFNSFDSFSLFLLKLPPPLLLLLLRQSCTLDVIRSAGRVDLLSCCRVRDSGMLTGIYLKGDQTVEGRLLLARVASAQREWYPMLGEMTLSRKTSQPTKPYNTVAYDQCALIKSDNSIPSFHSNSDSFPRFCFMYPSSRIYRKALCKIDDFDLFELLLDCVETVP